MIRPLPAPSLDRFRVLIADRIGLSFDEARSSTLSETLERRSRAHAMAVPSYLDQLEGLQASAAELSNLGAELTVGETYFFRHSEQLRAFSAVALPEVRKALAGTRPVRILSAGCASGEEAYSLAVLATEQGLTGDEAPVIRGIDLNPRALGRAKRAHYSEWALRETSEEMRRRYFRKEGNAYALLKERLPEVRFERANLIDDDAFEVGTFDILFCRNVLMYFTREQAIRTLRRLAGALTPTGFLFLGHAETLHGLSSDFDLLQAHGAFYYRKKDAGEGGQGGHDDARRQPETGRSVGDTFISASVQLDRTQTWLDAVDRSSQRIRALAESGAREAARPAQDAASKLSATLARRELSSLVQAERFDQALAVVDRMAGADGDADHLALRAALLTHSGRLDAAEQACLAALARDERSAKAHYLLALLRERQGKVDVAVEHDQIAIELDPTFAMPALHLGLLMMRARDAERARKAFERAIRLLEQEDPLRLLLFGGGFDRTSLIRLCQKELQRAGGAP